MVTVLREENYRARLEVGPAAWRRLTGGVAPTQVMLLVDGEGAPYTVR